MLKLGLCDPRPATDGARSTCGSMPSTSALSTPASVVVVVVVVVVLVLVVLLFVDSFAATGAVATGAVVAVVFEAALAAGVASVVDGGKPRSCTWLQ